jgi:DNA polymerase-3 subunit epsilon
MALQAGAIEWTATAGELGTGLRHLRTVRERGPRHNRRAREAGGAWVLRWQPRDEPLVTAVDLDALDSPDWRDLFGPFRSRRDALTALRGIAGERELCTSLLGLDGGPCSPNHRCRGACAGRESRGAHLLRLIEALVRLRMPAWPFQGAIALVEEDRARTRTELHVLREWRYIGSTAAAADLPALGREAMRLPQFDVDVYRLVRRALDEGERFRVIDLHAVHGGSVGEEA